MVTALTSSAGYQDDLDSTNSPAMSAADNNPTYVDTLGNIGVARRLDSLNRMIGEKEAARVVQIAINEDMQGDALTVDGVIGYKSLNAINMCGSRIYDLLCRLLSELDALAA